MISLSNVTVCFNSISILEIDQLEFNQNEFVCIIGKNGSGKSTLLKSILEFVPHQGEVTIQGINRKQLTTVQRAQKIAYMPQHREIPSMDVYTLIAHGRYPHLSYSKVLREEDKEKIEEAAKLVGVEHLLHRMINTLSGGERQKVYIAMMIAQDASMILLDEPTTFLDIDHQLDVLGCLQKLHRQGKGIVLVAHDLPQAFSIATRVVLLNQGRLVMQGKPKEIYQNIKIKENFGVSLHSTNEPNEIYQYQLKK